MALHYPICETEKWEEGGLSAGVRGSAKEKMRLRKECMHTSAVDCQPDERNPHPLQPYTCQYVWHRSGGSCLRHTPDID